MPLWQHDSDFSREIDFLEEDREIKALLKGWLPKVFQGITLWILHSRREKLSIWNTIKDIAWELASQLQNLQWELIQAPELRKLVSQTALQVTQIINSSWSLLGEEGIERVKEKIKLRAFMFWVLKLLKKSGFHTENTKKLQDVPSKYSQVFYDTLKDKPLSTLLTVLMSYDFVDLSKNQINDYEVEEEIKVLNIDRQDTIKKLQKLGAKKVFEWEVHDIYYDYHDVDEKLETSWWVKSTFRIREKTDWKGDKKYFFTIKRRVSSEEEEKFIESGVLELMWEIKTKRCMEKEFEIKDIKLFRKIIEWYGITPSREKKKKRISYSIENDNVKFDFDDYKGKQSMMEIEASKYHYIPEYIEKLWLSRHETSTSGSRKFISNPNTDKK